MLLFGKGFYSVNANRRLFPRPEREQALGARQLLPLTLLHALLRPTLKTHWICVCCFLCAFPTLGLFLYFPSKSNSQKPSNKCFHFSLTFSVFVFSITSALSEFTVHMLLPLTARNSLKLVSEHLTSNESCCCQGLLAHGEKKKNLHLFWKALRGAGAQRPPQAPAAPSPQQPSTPPLLAQAKQPLFQNIHATCFLMGFTEP